MDESPETIQAFRDLRPISRGFYAATYEAVTGALDERVVLKVAPVSLYAYFGKDFAEECKLHKQVAEGTEHLVAIRDMFDATVRFGTTDIPCHIAVLEYVPGRSLHEFIADPSRCTPTAIAQIAVDLFRLLSELERKRVYHNDLHDKNIIVQELLASVRRPDSLDDSIRAVAVDLGSLAAFDRREGARLGDLQAVVRHLFTLLGHLLENPDASGDVEYRLAAALEELGHALAPDAVMMRTPDYEQAIRQIRQAFEHVTSPWKEPRELPRFDDSYNAQTLHPWYVPQLLVDPDGTWLGRVSIRGPQVITGMRGCGKTMLLRALQFHARAFVHSEAATADEIVKGLHDDGYVGLYVSCTRLLDALGSEGGELHEPYARLFAAYAREALRAIAHLREIERRVGRALVASDAHRRLANVCANYLAGANELLEARTDRALEQGLQRILMSLDRGESAHGLRVNPTIAFPQLAETLLECSELWGGSQVLFLLDDVSTRHVAETAIVDLLSTLIFSNPLCAFKMTTELQTLELVLRSPGRIEKALAGRDYNPFDLGEEVNARLRDHRSRLKGKQFIAEILNNRAQHYRLHPDVLPAEVLGDASLESIARAIASHPETAKERKSAYHGLTFLTALCVGDIGDVISIYELILRKASARRELPAAHATQTECVQEYCARRLYNLSRRDGRLKDFALSFAAAAHDLLVRSYKEEVRHGRGRLRQYSSVYVRLTTQDIKEQYTELGRLVDAGVFVLEGGPDSPRKKSRDRDPVQQFILNYRKLFGLSSFVGLAERDRFELSGEDLAEWLAHPERGKEILLRNLGGPLVGEDRYEPGSGGPERSPILAVSAEASSERAGKGFQLDLDVVLASDSLTADHGEVGDSPTAASAALPPRAPLARVVTVGEAAAMQPTTLVLGLGFEDRTPASAERLMEGFSFQHALLVRYRETGHSERIERAVRERIGLVEIVDYEDVVASGALMLPEGLAITDVTGLAKPAIFQAVRRMLSAPGRGLIAHTRAESYWPLESDIERVLRADENRDDFALMEALKSVWPGERGPYGFVRMLPGASDESRRRVLCAAVTAKAERLLSLLEEREYDNVSLATPARSGPRARLAMLAAQVAVPDEQPEVVDSDDLVGELDFIGKQWQNWFVGKKFAFELGMTGSKMQAVACAAASVAYRVDQCWYVRPEEFDPTRFTKGVGETTLFELSLHSEDLPLVTQ